MNKEKQRIAIAEACGFKNIRTHQYPDKWLAQPPFEFDGLWPVYNYLNDLNAMHDAWETLSPTLQTAFSSVLFDVCGSWHAAANATAEQRAKAFLLVVGKWEDA